MTDVLPSHHRHINHTLYFGVFFFSPTTSINIRDTVAVANSFVCCPGTRVRLPEQPGTRRGKRAIPRLREKVAFATGTTGYISKKPSIQEKYFTMRF